MAARRPVADDGARPDVTADDCSAALRRARAGERVTIVGDDARPVAAVVPLDDLRLLQENDRRRDEAVRDILAFGELFRDDDPADLKRRVIAASAEARAELRAERDAGGV